MGDPIQIKKIDAVQNFEKILDGFSSGLMDRAIVTDQETPKLVMLSFAEYKKMQEVLDRQSIEIEEEENKKSLWGGAEVPFSLDSIPNKDDEWIQKWRESLEE